MLIALILTALLATDIAVAVLYVSTRPGRHARTAAPATSEGAAREIEDLVVTLRRQAEQATAEIGRQKAQLRRLLAGTGDAQPSGAADLIPAARPRRLPALTDDDLAETLPTFGPSAHLVTPSSNAAATPAQVRRLANEGMPARAIAGRARLSVEEVRLMLALSDERRSA